MCVIRHTLRALGQKVQDLPQVTGAMSVGFPLPGSLLTAVEPRADHRLPDGSVLNDPFEGPPYGSDSGVTTVR